MRSDQLLNADGTPATRFMAIWQDFAEKIENAFEALTTQVNDNTTLLAEIKAAQQLAQAANDNANATRAAQDLGTSYTTPTNVLTASSDGVIVITDHERVYPTSQTRVPVSGGVLEGYNPNEYVTVYYLDAGREGGDVNFKATTGAIGQEGDVHIVGQVTIPEAGAPPSEGPGPTAPGYRPPRNGPETLDYIEP